MSDDERDRAIRDTYNRNLLDLAIDTPLRELSPDEVLRIGLVPIGRPKNLPHIFDDSGEVNELLEIGEIREFAPRGACAYVKSEPDRRHRVFGEAFRETSFSVQYHASPGRT